LGGEAGPGCSSVGVGALLELGPFFPNSNGTGLVPNKHSWNKCKKFSDPSLIHRFMPDSCETTIEILCMYENPNLLGWFAVANIVFVESPASVGFSYSNTSSDYSYFSDDLTGNETNSPSH
jgi:carboxypeptidase C (cathepsin A)